MRCVLQEVMEKRRVAVDEVSSPPPESSFVIVTQNPSNQQGAGLTAGIPLRSISYECLAWMLGPDRGKNTT